MADENNFDSRKGLYFNIHSLTLTRLAKEMTQTRLNMPIVFQEYAYCILFKVELKHLVGLMMNIMREICYISPILNDKYTYFH